MSEEITHKTAVTEAADNATDTDTTPETEMKGEEVKTAESEPTAEQKSNRAHLTSSVPRAARVPTGVLTKGEMAEIREIFGDMDDTEIQRLYKRVTK